VIVPDTIEPYHGWKALRASDGLLLSPTYPTLWPPRQPLEASCTLVQTPSFQWKLVAAPPGWEQHFWIPSSFLQENSTTTFSWPPGEAPPGMTWIPEDEPHRLADCHCGIYVVADANRCGPYLYGQPGETRLLAEIALWGQTVLASHGARGQYAYPTRLYAAEQQAAVAVPVADSYGVPLELVRFLPATA
jgi:hypothetical protein